jgi:hypothetical protein
MNSYEKQKGEGANPQRSQTSFFKLGEAIQTGHRRLKGNRFVEKPR